MRDDTPDRGEPDSADVACGRAQDVPDAKALQDTIELLFFSYRDFTGEADAVLGERGLGRAHHRVLYFVWRHPGLAVTDLLDILKITKQSLARVLKQLVAGGYIVQRAGTSDKRQRLLYASKSGAELAGTLTQLQMKRIERAFAHSPADVCHAVRAFLFEMICDDERDAVARLMAVNEQDRPAAPGCPDVGSTSKLGVPRPKSTADET